MCVFYFVFVMNACLPDAPADTTATEILNPDSGLFNYSYCYCGALAQGEGGREEEGGGGGGEGEMLVVGGVVVFPKKGSFRWNIYISVPSGSIYSVSLPSCHAAAHNLSHLFPVAYLTLLYLICLSLSHLLILFPFSLSSLLPVHLICRSLSALCTDLSSTVFLSFHVTPCPPLQGSDHRTGLKTQGRAKC